MVDGVLERLFIVCTSVMSHDDGSVPVHREIRGSKHLGMRTQKIGCILQINCEQRCCKLRCLRVQKKTNSEVQLETFDEPRHIVLRFGSEFEVEYAVAIIKVPFSVKS